MAIPTDDQIMQQVLNLLSMLKNGVGFAGYQGAPCSYFMTFTANSTWDHFIEVIAFHLAVDAQRTFAENPSKILGTIEEFKKKFETALKLGLTINTETSGTIH